MSIYLLTYFHNSNYKHSIIKHRVKLTFYFTTKASPGKRYHYPEITLTATPTQHQHVAETSTSATPPQQLSSTVKQHQQQVAETSKQQVADTSKQQVAETSNIPRQLVHTPVKRQQQIAETSTTLHATPPRALFSPSPKKVKLSSPSCNFIGKTIIT